MTKGGCWKAAAVILVRGDGVLDHWQDDELERKGVGFMGFRK